MLLFVCSTSDFIVLKTLHNVQFSLNLSFKNNIRHNEISGCKSQITSNSYNPTGHSQYTLKSIAIFPFTQMTISKLHKFRSEIYLLSIIFYSPATKPQSFVRSRKKKSGNFGEYLSAFSNSVFVCLRVEFSLSFLTVLKCQTQLEIFNVVCKYFKKTHEFSHWFIPL